MSESAGLLDFIALLKNEEAVLSTLLGVPNKLLAKLLPACWLPNKPPPPPPNSIEAAFEGCCTLGLFPFLTGKDGLLDPPGVKFSVESRVMVLPGGARNESVLGTAAAAVAVAKGNAWCANMSHGERKRVLNTTPPRLEELEQDHESTLGSIKYVSACVPG